MNLTENPEITIWPETHYVFIEKVGPFQINAPKAWQELHPLVPEILDSNKITGYMSLYKMAPSVYRAGVSLAEEPENLPPGMKYEKFKGGKYSRFILRGSYSQLPRASGRVFEIVSEKQIRLRDDYCIENYVNDPRSSPEAELITQILIPTA
jgi:effector-binding domain-containing protein